MDSQIFGFASTFSVKNLAFYIGWFLLFVFICGTIVTLMILIMVKKKQKKIIEINMQNRRMRIFSGRTRKKGKNVSRFWAQKIGRSLPDFQQKSIFVKGQQDTVILLKDNNGMYHTARIPTQTEITKWYKAVYGIDLFEKDDDGNYVNKGIDKQKLRDIFLLPSPHEDLDWLSNQIAEADREFKIDSWWQSPTIAYIGVGFVCLMMIVVTKLL